MVDDISQFPDSGVIQIDAELLSYSGTQGLLAAAGAASSDDVRRPGVLLNVQRGVGGTMPSAHDRGALVLLVVAVPTPTPTKHAEQACAGDCNPDGQVTVEELLTMVNIALGERPLSDCPAGDANVDQQITVDEILTAVNNALDGCG